MEDAEKKVRVMLLDVVRSRGLEDPIIDLKPLSSGGGNYTSALFTATAHSKSQELAIFAKIAIVSEKLRAVMDADLMFATEGIVYQELATEYNNLQKRFKINIFDFPEMYACDLTRGSETLLLEDLTKRGFSTPSRLRSAEWRFAAAAISKLAAFHALSLALEKHEPVKFKNIADRMVVKDREQNEEMKDVWRNIIGSCVLVVKEEHKRRLVEFLTVPREEIMLFKKPINKVVLAHGDYRTSNLLAKDQGEDLQVMVVDFQTIHTGSPTADVLYFIFLGTNQEFRRSHYQQLLDLYYQALASNTEKMGVDVSEVYPRDMFDSEITEMLPRALRLSSFILPIVTVDEAKAPLTSGEADLAQFNITPNQLFKERFSELVSDCVEWGVL